MDQPRSSKRSASEAFGQRLMTDVPECYNYGVFFDDGYDYLKHMKSLKEFVQDPNYVGAVTFFLLTVYELFIFILNCSFTT